MGKAKRRGKKRQQAVQPTYDSDDERAYSKEAVPDPNSEEYFQDEVDQFHAKRDKILLKRGVEMEPAGYSSDEEVMALDDDEEDDDAEIQRYQRQLKLFRSRGFKEEMASDVEEDAGNADGLPDEKAWGKRRSKYYGADVSDDDDIDFSGSEPDAAILEEQEAMALQRKMAEQLDEEDFGLDQFEPAQKKPREDDEEGQITKDLSTLSKREKLLLVQKESPELLELIEDYKVKMKEVTQRLLPIFDLIKKGALPSSTGTEYVHTKLRLCLNYCINVTFYVLLKARRTSVRHHPVMGRLVQYRNMLKQLKPADEQVKEEMDRLLERLKRGEEIKTQECAKDRHVGTASLKRRKLLKVVTSAAESRRVKAEKKRSKLSEMAAAAENDEQGDMVAMETGGRTWGRKRSQTRDEDGEALAETAGEKEALAFYNMMKAGRKKGGVEEDDGDIDDYDDEVYAGEDEEDGDAEGDGKRGITYQIEKNKGLTPKRKREQRNPRVKHRMKFRKAKIRRKGQVREVRTEMTRYSGEISGIRAGVKKSVRLK